MMEMETSPYSSGRDESASNHGTESTSSLFDVDDDNNNFNYNHENVESYQPRPRHRCFRHSSTSLSSESDRENQYEVRHRPRIPSESQSLTENDDFSSISEFVADPFHNNSAEEILSDDDISLEDEFLQQENYLMSDDDDQSDRNYTNDSSDSSDNDSDDAEAALDEPLFENSTCSTKSFSYVLKVFSIKHSLSNKTMDDLLKIFGLVLPANNNCPSSTYKLNKNTKEFEHNATHFQLCRLCHTQLQRNTCVNENCDEHGIKCNNSLNFFTFDVEKQLQKIVQSYPEDVITYKHDVFRGSYIKAAHGEVYRSKSENCHFVSMVWHIDGAPTVKSQTLNIWLITAFIVEVPKKYRFALRNIIICGIWYGSEKPNFDLFQLHFVREIKRLMQAGFTVILTDGEETFYLKIEASLADLPARASSLSIKQFNGRFGCPVCLHPGKSLNGTTTRVYPYKSGREKPSLRTHQHFLLAAEAAELSNDSFFGVKGRSVILDITTIPYEIPFDYMHLILEGELKRKLSRHLFSDYLTAQEIGDINDILREVKYPHDFSKKVLNIDGKSVRKGKAGYLQVVLLHVLLPVIKSRVPDNIFCHVGLLVTASQILNNDQADENDIFLAEEMLEEYHRLDASIYGEQSQTFTNHALIHLGDQRRKHGCPLVLISNFVFEGFIATLKRQYHGTRGIVSQMVSKIGLLQNIHEIAQCVENEQLRMLANEIVKGVSPRKTEMADGVYFYGKVNDFPPQLSGLPPLPDDFEDRYDQFCERIYFEDNVYHSMGYRLKRNSNSYTVSYRDRNLIKYGRVLFYACRKDSNEVWMVLRKLKPTKRTLFSVDMKDSLESDKINTYIDLKQLGQGYKHVKDSNDFVAHPAKFLISRLIFIPDDIGGFVSSILNSYQHD